MKVGLLRDVDDVGYVLFGRVMFSKAADDMGNVLEARVEIVLSSDLPDAKSDHGPGCARGILHSVLHLDALRSVGRPFDMF